MKTNPKSCPEVKISKKQRSICLVLDFRELLDSKVSIKFKEKSILIDILAQGCLESCLDPGLPILKGDGTPIYFENNDIFIEYDSRVDLVSISQFRYLQVAMLKVCVESFRCNQMLESNPCLLWVLLDFACVNNSDVGQIDSILGLKRKNILLQIFGHLPNGVDRFISKIRLLNGAEGELEVIKRAVRNQSIIEGFAHFEEIPIQVLYLAERHSILIGARYVFDICLSKKVRMSHYLEGIQALCKKTEDTINLGVALNIKNASKLVRSCRNISELDRLHDKWTISLNKSKTFYEPDIEFDFPPIREVDGVKWLSTANALIREGIEMEHCIATYVNKAKKGSSIIFSVFDPERATLEVGERDGKYYLKEIKKKNNLEVSESTRKKVQKWLRVENDRLLQYPGNEKSQK